MAKKDPQLKEKALVNFDHPRRGRARHHGGRALVAKPVMLLVLGMHRSGTSVCARLLQCLGAISSRNLNPGNTFNPKGYFEDFDVYQFNDRQLLPRLQRDWHSTAPVDWSLLSDTDRSRLALSAVQILRGNFSTSNPLSVLKEPRIGILLPFWLSVLAHAGYEVKIVCALRDPVSVARSLWERDKISTPHAGLLYLSYWLSILHCLRALPVAFVQFDEIVADPQHTAEKLARQLSLPAPSDFPGRMDDFKRDFLTPDLRHHRFNVRDLELEPDMPALTLELYRQLLRSAQARSLVTAFRFAAAREKDLSLLQPVLVEFDHAHQTLRAETRRADALQEKIAALEGNLSQCSKESSPEARGALAELLTRLKSENAALQAQSADLLRERNLMAGRLATLESEQASLAAQQQSLVTENASLVTARQTLEDHHASLSAAMQNLEEQAGERGALAEKVTRLESENAALQAQSADLLHERDQMAGRLATLESGQASLESLQQELAANHEREMADERAKSTELQTGTDQLERKLAAAQQGIQERFEELATLTRLLIEKDGALEATSLALAQTRGVMAEKVSRELRQYSLERGRLAEHGTWLNTTLEETRVWYQQQINQRDTTLEETRVWYEQQITQRDQSAEQLAADLRAKERLLAELRQELRYIKDDPSWKIARPLRAVLSPWSPKSKDERAFRAVCQAIRASELFDDEWYLTSYPDVAATGMNALEHYVNFGGLEGRKASGRFDAASHMARHPDVSFDTREMHPVLHYLATEAHS